jgi:type III secretion protein Q
MPDPQPLELPAPGLARLRLDHQLFGLARELVWPSLQTRLTLTPADESQAPASFDLWCEWEAGSRQGHAACRTADLAKLATAALHPWFDAEMPTELAAFLRESALAPWLEALESILGLPVHLRSWSNTPPAVLPPSLLVQLQVGDQTRATALLAAEAAVLSPIAEAWAKIASLVDGAETTGLPVPFVLEAGRKTLPASAWKNLAPGDVVILDSHTPATDLICLVRVGDHLSFSAKSTGKKIELLAPVATEINPPAVAAPSGESWADALPVTLVFEAGRVELPLQELRALRPGYCFELPQAPGAQVVLMANGQPVGEGEMVRVGEVLGVRVVRMRLP